MKIIVTTDSTSDVPKDLQKLCNISVAPLIVNLGDTEYYDGVNLTIEDIFGYVELTGILPKTAARSCEFYKEFFTSALKKHKADKLIHISLSAELSSSFENAKAAACELDFVRVIDSRSLSSGCALLALSAHDKISEGKNLEEIVEEIESDVLKTQASFILNDLKYIYKGGRCSAIAAFGGNILRIKPKIKLSDGKMKVDKKYMGKLHAVLDKYVDDLFLDNPNPILKRVFVTYTTELPNVNKSIEKKLKEKGFENIIFNFAGSTIASHCGRNCLGVLYICESEV